MEMTEINNHETIDVKIARLDEKVGFVLQEMRDLKSGTCNDIAILKKDKADRRDVEVLQKVVNTDIEQRMRGLESSALNKSYFDEKHESLSKEVDQLRISDAVLNSKASVNQMYISYAIALAGLIIGLVEAFLKFKL